MTTLSITTYLHNAEGTQIGERKGEAMEAPWLSSFVAVDDLVRHDGRSLRVNWREWDPSGNLIVHVSERVVVEERAA